MDNRTLEEVRNNETKLIEEIKSLEKQLDYLRSGEYYNQLRFENEMLQQVIDTNGVPSEVYDYIDCTHRNTELLEENQSLKKQFENKYSKTGILTNEVLYEENTKLINQQKEFIEWLEEKEKQFDVIEDPINSGACLGILRKYKEIIGGKEKNNKHIATLN